MKSTRIRALILGALFTVGLAPLFAVSLGHLGPGVASKENASGEGYLLFNPNGVIHGRIVHPGSSQNFLAVFRSNDTWRYYKNEESFEFQPQADDYLVAEVNYGADTVQLLNNTRGFVHGIRSGYQSGDLVVTANRYNGSANFGEFGLSGTSIELNPEPLWWYEKGIIDLESGEANHRAPANLGQVKWMVLNAYNKILEINPDLALLIRNDLVGTEATHPFTQWPPSQSSNDRSPTRIGQLKAVSAPFYKHLNEAASEWLELEMINVGTRQQAGFFPWGPDVGKNENRTIANLGQLKAIFSLRFASLPNYLLDEDRDGDGLPDEEELLAGTNPEAPDHPAVGLSVYRPAK